MISIIHIKCQKKHVSTVIISILVSHFLGVWTQQKVVAPQLPSPENRAVTCTCFRGVVLKWHLTLGATWSTTSLLGASWWQWPCLWIPKHMHCAEPILSTQHVLFNTNWTEFSAFEFCSDNTGFLIHCVARELLELEFLFWHVLVIWLAK